MKFKFISRIDGSRDYSFNGEITRSEFFSLIKALSDSLGATADLISIPEAEIGKINLLDGDIYAKFDIIDGFDLKSTGLSPDQEMQLEKILLERWPRASHYWEKVQ